MKAKLLERKQGVGDMISCLVTSLADLKIWILKVVGRGSFGKKLTGRTGSGHMTYAPHKLVSSRIEREPVFVSRPITSAVGKAALSQLLCSNSPRGINF